MTDPGICRGRGVLGTDTLIMLPRLLLEIGPLGRTFGIVEEDNRANHREHDLIDVVAVMIDQILDDPWQ